MDKINHNRSNSEINVPALKAGFMHPYRQVHILLQALPRVSYKNITCVMSKLPTVLESTKDYYQTETSTRSIYLESICLSRINKNRNCYRKIYCIYIYIYHLPSIFVVVAVVNNGNHDNTVRSEPKW